MGLPFNNAAVILAAPYGSDPITFVSWDSYLNAEIIPAISPPPPTGQII